MYCWSCGHKNSDANKFCGECGKVQVRPPVFVDEDEITDNVKTMNPPSRQDKRVSDVAPAQATKDRPSLQAPVVPPPGTGIAPTPPPPRYASTNPLIGESRVVREQPQAPDVTELMTPVVPVVSPIKPANAMRTPVQRDTAAEEIRGSTRISGPSFLGLSDAPDSSGSSEYLLEDDAESSSTARSYIALGLVLLLGVLIYKQWDAVSSVGRDLIARATVTESAPTVQSSPEDQSVTTASNTDQPAYHGLDDVKPESDNTATPAETTAQEKKLGEADAEKPATDLTAEKAANEAPPAGAKDAEVVPTTAKKAEVQPSKPAAVRQAVDTAPAAPVYDDSQLEIAQKYLQGRGVAQDCNRGVSLLRSAAMQPNPKAQIKLGALYATGHCVSQDRAEAYRWFAEAHQLQPGNQWIDKNLNSLWAAMTAEERGRAQR